MDEDVSPDAERVGLKSSIQSIDRAVAMLTVIADAGRAGVVLGSIAGATGVHASTARTILSSLVTHGFVDQDARSRRYRLGPAVFELNKRYAAQLDLAAVAAPYIRRVWEASRETVHLAVLQSGRRVDLSVLVSPQILNVNPTVGGGAETENAASDASSVNSLYTTAAGKILLLSMSAAVRAQHLAQIGAVVTPHGTISAEDVLEDLAIVEATGIATNLEDEEPGVCGIAAPIFDADGAVCAALCIGYPAVRRSAAYDEVLRTLAREAAEEVSIALGATTGLDADAV